MAKFCIICGAELVDGECPNKCNFSGQKKNILKDVFINLISLGKKSLLNPIETIANAEGKDVTVFAMAFIVLGAAVNALLPIVGYYNEAPQIGLLMTNLLYSEFPADSFGYGYIFAQSFILGLFQLFGVVLGIYIIGGLFFQGKQSFKKSLAIVGLAQLPVTVVTVIALITSYIHVAIGAVFLLLSFTLATSIYYQGARDFLEISQRKSVFLIPLSYVVSMLFTIVLMALFSH